MSKLIISFALNEERYRKRKRKKKNFIKKTEHWVKQQALKEDNLITGGDQNGYLNDSDRNTLTHINVSSRINFKHFTENLKLYNVWQKLKKFHRVYMVE